MATAGDGATPYQSGGAGGKFRKRPIRRSAQATPYDRPSTVVRNNNPSLFAKLVDPASRLIYAGADRLFGVFRKRLPSIAAPRPPEVPLRPETCEEPEPSTDDGGNLVSIPATTEISELESMLKQKTFTRSEIEHLTALLHAKATNSDGDEGDRAKLPSPSSRFLRLEASTSSPLIKHLEERENIHAAISTPVATSRAFEEDVASPAELARAYMGTRTPKVSPSSLRFGSQAPRQDSALLNNTTILPKTPIASLAPRTAGTFKGIENSLTTPRSRGRSAIYSMARTPYYRPPSTFSQKGINSPSLPLSRPAWEQEGSIESSKMASKRRSSVLDDIGSGGPVRRIRQKANLLSQGSPLSKHRSEFSQKLLLRNEPDPKGFKAIEENGETSRSSLGYASVPTKSTQMATKILEQLERLSPKEKSPGSRVARTSEKSPPTSSTMHGQAFGSLDKVDSPKLLLSSRDNQKPESWLLDARESTSQSKGKEKVEENGPRKFAVPRNVLSTMNGNSTVAVRDNGPIVTNTDSTFKLPAEPPQKKRFQMSAHEDYLEVDDENRSNGHLSIPFGQNKKAGTSVLANKDVSAEVIQTPALPEVHTASLPQADKISGNKKIDDSKSLSKADSGSIDGPVVNKKVTFNFSASSPSSSNTQAAVPPQSTFSTDAVASQKKTTVFPTFGASNKNTENVPPFSFSANEPSGFKPNVSSDAKSLSSTSMFNSVKENDHVQFSAFKKEESGSSLKSANMFSKSESVPSASPTPTLASTTTSGVFSFGAKNTSIANGAPASSPSTIAFSPSFPASSTSTTNNFFTGSSSSSSTTASLASTAATSASSGVLPLSSPAPIFKFGSAIASSTKTSEPPETTATKDKEPSSDIITTPPFASASFGSQTTGGNSMFGFSSPAATSSANDHHSQGSLFNGTSGFQSSFGGTTVIPSLFGSSAPAFGTVPSFGLSSVVASSETKSGSSTSSPTTNISGSAFSSTPGFGLNSALQPPKSSAFGSTSTAFSFGASSTSTSPSVFGSSSNAGASTGSSMFSFSATNSGFPAPSQAQPIFGNSTPVFGSTAASPNSNDQMSMEDSMAEDSTPTPPFPAFGQAPSAGTPGFMFGSATPTSFQFGGQTNQPPSQNPFQANQTPSQNPFQASGSAEFSAGGSFSLGSGGGDKSGRRIIKVKSKNRRK